MTSLSTLRTIGLVALATALPAGATTVRPLDFGELVGSADLVVVGEVTAIRTVASGGAATPGGPKTGVPPKAEGELADAPKPPRSLGVEGGRMLFTEVTLAVERAVLGSAPPTLTFRLAGGREGSRRVVVHGMPEVAPGERYLLFLRPGFERTAVPIVGVHQGIFRLVGDPGGENLLDADGDLVVGVEDDRIVVRYASGAPGTGPRLGDPPRRVSDGAPARTSPEVARYWTSSEAGMTLTELEDAVRERKEALR